VPLLRVSYWSENYIEISCKLSNTVPQPWYGKCVNICIFMYSLTCDILVSKSNNSLSNEWIVKLWKHPWLDSGQAKCFLFLKVLVSLERGFVYRPCNFYIWAFC